MKCRRVCKDSFVRVPAHHLRRVNYHNNSNFGRISPSHRTVLSNFTMRTRESLRTVKHKTNELKSYQTTLSDLMISKFDSMIKRYTFLTETLSAPDEKDPREVKKLTREMYELASTVELYKSYKQKLTEVKEIENMLKAEEDEEIRELAIADREKFLESLEPLEKDLILSLLPKDVADSRNVILEVRPGPGGQEAGLFAMEMFNMYKLYSNRKGWRFDPLDIQSNDVGGFKEATASITGYGVFGIMKYESGVHRVQRVPLTGTLINNRQLHLKHIDISPIMRIVNMFKLLHSSEMF